MIKTVQARNQFHRSSNPRRTRNSSWSTAISDNFAGSIQKQDHAKSEELSRHLVLGRTWVAFPWL